MKRAGPSPIVVDPLYKYFNGNKFYKTYLALFQALNTVGKLQHSLGAMDRLQNLLAYRISKNQSTGVKLPIPF